MAVNSCELTHRISIVLEARYNVWWRLAEGLRWWFISSFGFRDRGFYVDFWFCWNGSSRLWDVFGLGCARLHCFLSFQQGNPSIWCLKSTFQSLDFNLGSSQFIFQHFSFFFGSNLSLFVSVFLFWLVNCQSTQWVNINFLKFLWQKMSTPLQVLELFLDLPLLLQNLFYLL